MALHLSAPKMSVPAETRGPSHDRADDGGVAYDEQGGAFVDLAGGAPEVEQDPEHFANLADVVDQGRLDALVSDLIERIENDKTSRELRDQQYEEGLRRTGLGNDAPGGAEFDGASKVVHPMLTEASVDFASRAGKELLPATGPAKQHIPGKQTADKLAKAKRKAAHMNWQLCFQIKEFRHEVEQLLSQLPLGGSQYLKLGWDPQKRRPTVCFVPIEEVFLPYAASSFYTAERKTHWQRITHDEFERRVASGMYRKVEVPEAVNAPDQSKAEKANEKIEGKAETGDNEDGLRPIYEVYLESDIEDSERPVPYVLSIDVDTRNCVGLYRNWQIDDPRQEELGWIVEFPLIPWRGAYAIGIAHMIGGLSGGATGALRALLDAAHISNFQGALKLKGAASKGGQSKRINPTEVTEIEGSTNVDDIRKTILPMPFNPPSLVLFQLLGFLVDAGKGVVRTTFDDLAEASNANMPVGTTLALIEQGMQVYSAIHGRLHAAMQRVLEILHRINQMYLDEDELRDDAGELLAYLADYDGPLDVVPVSDPNIFSETQRHAQGQAVAQRAAQNPLYDQMAVERMLLQLWKVPNFEELLVKVPKPKKMNAVNENLAATLGRPVMAFPEQNHLAHLQAHLDYLRSPMFGMNPLFAGTCLPKLLDHIKEHIALWYADQMFQLMNEATGVDVSTLMNTEDNDDEDLTQDFDRLIAAASPRVVAGAAQVFGALPPILGEAIALVQSQQPALPPDPMAARAAVALQDVQRKAKETETTEQHEDARTAAEIQSRENMNRADNDTAKEIVLMEAATNARTNLKNGRGINPNP